MTKSTSCPRCRHETNHLDTWGRVRLRFGGKAHRRMCGADSEHGWPCQCRSRFHVTLS